MNKAHTLLFALMMMTVSLSGYLLENDDQFDSNLIDLENESVVYLATMVHDWDVVDTNGGTFNSLATDNMGNPHVAYYSHENSSLKYAMHDGNNWIFSTIDADGVQTDSKIAIASDGIVHVIYSGYDMVQGSVLKHAQFDGSEWVLATVANYSVSGTRSPSNLDMTLDSDVGIHVVLQVAGPNSSKYLYYHQYDGQSWTSSGLNASFDELPVLEGETVLAGYAPSLAIDDNDYVHVSYEYSVYNLDAFTGRSVLVHSMSNGSGWTHSIVDEISQSTRMTYGLGFSSSMVLDSLGDVHITYSSYGLTAAENTNGSILKYAHLNAGEWAISTVDNTTGEEVKTYSRSDLGKCSSLVVDVNDNLHVTYIGGEDLKYASFIQGEWTLNSLQLPYTEKNLGSDINACAAFILSSTGQAHLVVHDDLLFGPINFQLRHTILPLDLDGDGVAGEEDKCPNMMGNSTYDRLGCLDTDGDGYSDPNSDWTSTDGADAFPSLADQWSDQDGDGYGDNQDGEHYDQCPNSWGNSSIEGCMDSDSDGVADSFDAFPNNSSEQYDSDGDGFGENTDAFPRDRFEWSDSDGDGVGNNEDVCPDVAGIQAGESPGCVNGYGNTEEDESSLPGFGFLLTITAMLGAILVSLRRNSSDIY